MTQSMFEIKYEQWKVSAELCVFLFASVQTQGESEEINFSTIANMHTSPSSNILAHHTPQGFVTRAKGEIHLTETLSPAGEPMVHHRVQVPQTVGARRKKTFTGIKRGLDKATGLQHIYIKLYKSNN